MFKRTEILLREDFEKVKNANVIVFGCGGVGGYVVEMLARMGISKLTLVDFDTISTSNLNRQIIAMQDNVGKFKVQEFKKRILKINSNAEVIAITDKLLPENLKYFNLESYDYIADCIDMVSSKVALMQYAYENNLPLISAMGTGNRTGIPNFVVTDIFDTEYDGLSKVLRRELRKRNVKKSKVVFCKEQAISTNSKEIGSVVYYPAMCGCVMSAFIIQELTNKK